MLFLVLVLTEYSCGGGVNIGIIKNQLVFILYIFIHIFALLKAVMTEQMVCPIIIVSSGGVTA